ncbi:hypothetical protein HDU67_008125 [Dinochytrium kinnereticum]|nr:hypothetical protein HDU67_008125 [Dinochytrium kinnereticum]
MAAGKPAAVSRAKTVSGTPSNSTGSSSPKEAAGGSPAVERQHSQTGGDAPKGSPGHARSQPPAGSQRIGPYVLGKTLGVGSTGRVKLGIHMETNHKVAIKIISKDSLSHSDDPATQNLPPEKKLALNKKIEREITIMKLIQHPNIMQLYDVYETEKELFLILEHVEGGELFDYLVKRGRLLEDEALQFFQQIIYGVDFCHRHLICHRDLKPENLLLDKDRNVKIADFGMASLQVTGKMLETSCGSPHYASPEIIKGIKYDGPSADVWSCGVILYALLTGNLPFDDENIRRLLSKVKSGMYFIPEHVGPLARDLIKKMLVVDPANRMTMSDVMSHPWFISKSPPNLSQLTQLTLNYESALSFAINDPALIDREVVSSLNLLGWGEEETLVAVLTSPQTSMEKVFYGLLCQRKMEYFENYDISRMSEWDIEGGPRRRADSYASLYADRSGGSRYDLFRSDACLSPVNPSQTDNTLTMGRNGNAPPSIMNPEALRTIGRRSADELVVRRSAEELRGGVAGKEASIDTRKSLDALHTGGGSGHEKVGSEAVMSQRQDTKAGQNQSRRVVSESAGRVKIAPAAAKFAEAHVRVNSPLAASINFFDEDSTKSPTDSTPTESKPPLTRPTARQEDPADNTSSSSPQRNIKLQQALSSPAVVIDSPMTSPNPSASGRSGKLAMETKRKLTINTQGSSDQLLGAVSPLIDSGVSESPRFHRKKVITFQTTQPRRTLAITLDLIVKVLKENDVRFQPRKEGGFKCKYDGLAALPMPPTLSNQPSSGQLGGSSPMASPVGGPSVLQGGVDGDNLSAPVLKSVKFKIDVFPLEGSPETGIYKIQMVHQQATERLLGGVGARAYRIRTVKQA